ncbi:MAG: deoxyribose-phosphate aldolase [Ignavibacteria bacterium]|nr:deoxyribose-phosphate aldolase [Ignavibacteria bacterium]
MRKTIVDRIIQEVLIEHSLQKSYCDEGICAPCGHCVFHKKDAVQNIIDNGAERITTTIGIPEPLELDLARMIDHTLLKPDATIEEVKKLCDEARQYHFVSVCVNPSFVKYCAVQLQGTDVKVCTVIGFPLGSSSTEIKRAETRQAIQDGAKEIDMVLNIGMLKSKELDYVFKDVQQVVLEAKPKKIVTKVILETCLLSDEEKVKACIICKEAGADFVKTSTGFSKGGATVGDIALMRKVVGGAMGVKASGGIRSREDADMMIASGADRIGASASVKIVTNIKDEKSGGY